MNCDQVFDILTRGPFPTGQQCDASVERHLSHCAGCRRLAEALQPALELIQESVEPEEGRNLPTYWGALLDDAGEESMSTTPEVGSRSRRADSLSPLRSSPRGGLWPTLGGIAAAIAVGLMIGAPLGPFQLPEPLVTRPAGTIADAPAESRGQQISTLALAEGLTLSDLSLACLSSEHVTAWMPTIDHQADGNVSLAQLQWSELACCTECHRSGGPAAAPRLAAKIAMSCQHCHTQ